MENGKIVSIEDRIPKLKELRKRKANRRLILLLSLFFILIACVIYFISPLSEIRSIKVQGNRYISSGKIIQLSGLSEGSSIWKVGTKEIAGEIKRYPEIKSASVAIKLPSTVLITVADHDRIAYLANDGRFFPILENGEILEPLKKQEIPVHAPVLIDFKKGKALNQLLNELEKIPQEITNSISEIHHTPKKTDTYHITLYMNDGYEVSATSRTLSDKLVHYPSIISQLQPGVKGVIDLEVASFFKAYETKVREANKGKENDSDESER
ncbi:cell division protein FtsQ [Peribacillus saganii]|uniref:Cell division protein DivIB n=1 Tax=Peribacillus saganii TaxID=2303992 RepID=A0A372LSJ1_9BACI|nr:FtsQ-type POTRA domain-containing protein [Peribacillus saganii]RFU71181.1 cell division protein FtsQ [Peribacillus saganii]